MTLDAIFSVVVSLAMDDWHEVRYVGVISFVLHILRVYQLDLHNKTRVAFATLQRNICINRIENHTSPYLVMDVELLAGHKGIRARGVRFLLYFTYTCVRDISIGGGYLP